MQWSLRVRAVLAVASGALLAVSFPPYDLWWLLPPAVAGLTLACSGASSRGGALIGFVGGLAFFGLLLGWMRVVGPDAWVALTLLQAAFWAVLGLGLAAVARLPGWPAWAAAVWVLVEALRSVVPWGGFPWGRLAHALVDSPLLGYVELGGVALLTAAAAAAGALLAAGVVAVTRGEVGHAAAAVVLTVVLVGGGVVSAAVAEAPEPREDVTIAVVQGNVPRAGLDFFGQREAVLRNHVEATLELAEDVAAGEVEPPDLVLWPENSSDIDPFVDPEAYALIDGAVAAIGVPIVVGVLVGTSDGTQTENSAIVWDPRSGPGDRYVKRHPVPFGEYIPAREVLAPFISRLDRVPRDMRPGQEPGVLAVGPATLGVVICFEIFYDAETRDAITGGGEVLVVQTNNATYGRTGMPEQQFAASRLRAVEHGREVLIASTSGISGVIHADGSVVQATEEFTQRVLVERVPLRTELTWATQSGAWVAAGLSLVGALGVALGLLRGRRRAGGDAPSDAPVSAGVR